MRIAPSFLEREVTCRLRQIGRELSRTSSTGAMLLLVALGFLGRGGALIPGLSGDDYRWIQLDHLPWEKWLGEGRTGQAVISRLLEYLGAGTQWTWAMFGVIHLLVWPAVALLVMRFWKVPVRSAAPLVAAAILASHPFSTELFTYRTNGPIHAMAICFAALALWPRIWDRRTLVVFSLILVAAFSIVQTALHLTIMVALTGLALWSVQSAAILEVRPVGAWTAGSASLKKRSVWLLLASAVGLAGYLLASSAVNRIVGVPFESRAAFVPWGGWAARLREGVSAVVLRLVHPGPVAPWGASLLQSALLLAVVVLLARRIAQSRSSRARTRYVLGAIVLGAAALWIVGLMWVLRDFFPTPRLTFHANVFWAACFLLADRLFRSDRGRACLLLLGTGLIVSYLGTSNRILSDQYRLTMRDQLKANRILVELERLPDFEQVKRLAIVGGSWTYPQPFHTLDGLLNTSAFASWTRVSLFTEVAGRPFAEPRDEEERRAGTECASRAAWPAPEGVFVEGELAVVCLELSHQP